MDFAGGVIRSFGSEIDQQVVAGFLILIMLLILNPTGLPNASSPLKNLAV